MYFNIYLKKYALHIICFLFLCIIGFAVAFAKILPKSTVENSSMQEDSIEVPLIMYHGLIKEQKLQNKFMISPDFFDSDLRYLKDNGYTTIFVKDLIDYVYNDIPLPPKPIMLTFDDGYYNNYLYAFPLLKKYDSKMVLAPIGKCTEQYSKIDERNAAYSHVTWNDICEMVDSGLVEIQNHSYNLHSNNKSRIGSKKMKSESNSDYKKTLVKDLSKMQDEITKHTKTTPTAFVYPFGAVSDISVEILKEIGFKATFICENKMNKISKDPDCLFGLCRFIRTNKVSSKEFFNKILTLS